MRTEVLVIGGGPAAYSSAIALRQLGRQVILVRRMTDGNMSWGETLPGSVKRSLNRLGLWQQFLQDGHLPCYGYSSAWGSASLVAYSFIQSAYGHGWYIRRRLFEQRLRERACLLGVVEQAAVSGMRLRQLSSGSWELRSGHSCIESDFIIDASGRNSWVGRQLGITRVVADRQVCLVSFSRPVIAASPINTSLVESVASGWWYTAPVAGNKLVSILFTSQELIDKHDTAAIFREAWERSIHTRDLGGTLGFCRTPPRIVQAGSSHLGTFGGRGWIAVGDAAICYNPLAAHGISFALTSACDGALAVHNWLDGEGSAVEQYAGVIAGAQMVYGRSLEQFFAAERRWPDARFWKCRGPVPGSPVKEFIF